MPDDKLAHDVNAETFYLAVCRGCRPVLPQPFYVEAERDEWAGVHETSTGHEVERAVEVRHGGRPVPAHESAPRP